MNPWLLLVLGALAVYRATRLVLTDRITAPPRRWLLVWLYCRTDRLTDENAWQAFDPHHVEDYAADDPERPWLAWLLTCWWCASVWVAAAAVWLWWVAPGVAEVLAWLLALAALAPIIRGLVDRE